MNILLYKYQYKLILLRIRTIFYETIILHCEIIDVTKIIVTKSEKQI